MFSYARCLKLSFRLKKKKRTDGQGEEAEIQVEKGGWSVLAYYKAELREAKVGLQLSDIPKGHMKPKFPVNN